MFSYNTTNSSSINHFNESSCNSSSGTCSPVQICPGKAVHLAYISVICVVGVIGNILLLYADYKEWKKSKTPDKVLIFNLAMTNVAALLASLPLQAVVVSNFDADNWPDCSKLYLHSKSFQVFSLHFFNLVTLGTITVVGIDRYEALTKFAHQRTLDVKRSVIAIGLVWMCSVTVTLVFVFTWRGQCGSAFSSSEDRQTKDKYTLLRVVIISIWITVCCTVTCTSLLLAARRIRQHRQEINAMFTPVQAAVQITFTKGIIALSLCYIILWVPYGVSAAILPSKQNNATFMCSHLWTVSTCYMSFSLLSPIYFIVDSRLGRAVRIGARVHPVSMPSQNNVVTAQVTGAE